MEGLFVARFVVFVLFAISQCATDGGANVADGGPEVARDGTPIGKKEEPSTEDRLKLFQYDPVKLGHVHRVADESGRILELVTTALNPPIFEIRNFLSGEECDRVINLAKEVGLENSEVEPELLPSLSDRSEDEIIHFFQEMDVNTDNYLDTAELANGLMDMAGGLLSEEDVSSLLADLQLDSDHDQQLDFHEFQLSWTPEVEKLVNKWVEDKQASNETFRFSSPRGSDQTWLDQTSIGDATLTRLHERVVKLMQLPKDIVVSSEDLQVVRYQVGSHYHAHHDSSELDDSLPCSHSEDVLGGERESEINSRTCRYATVLFYLNDVKEGGETVFPVADNGTYSKEAFDTMAKNLHDLTHHCDDSNLVVKAERGKAILWYNHQVNTSNGWMGDTYKSSLHGECGLRKGEKWIANNWINIDDNYQRQMDYHKSFNKELVREKEAQHKGEEHTMEDPSDHETETDEEDEDDEEEAGDHDEL